MAALYTHCPHCGFPVVVNGVERMMARYCRQCRGKYVPMEPLRSSGHRGSGGMGRKRAALQTHLKQRRRSVM